MARSCIPVRVASKNFGQVAPRSDERATTTRAAVVPGLLANVIGTAIAGVGIYKRQTATLMKELEA